MSTDLLERLAERGTPRGPANVWADAQEPSWSGEPDDNAWNTWGFRVALSVVTVVVGFGLFAGLRGDGAALSTAAETDQPATDEPLPAPLLIDGAVLEVASRPSNPAFDADTIFEPDRDPDADEEWRQFAEEQLAIPIEMESIIFATNEGGFDETFVILDDATSNLPLAHVANIAEAEAARELDQFFEYEESLIERDPISTDDEASTRASFQPGNWSIDSASGLSEVWRYSDQTITTWNAEWRLRFGDGADEATLFVAPAQDTLWSFFAFGGTFLPDPSQSVALANETIEPGFPSEVVGFDTGTVLLGGLGPVDGDDDRGNIEPILIEAVGEMGYRVEVPSVDLFGNELRDIFSDAALWTDGDFIYQLRARDLDAALSNLQLVDRSTWVAEVQAAPDSLGGFFDDLTPAWIGAIILAGLLLVLVPGLIVLSILRSVRVTDLVAHEGTPRSQL